MAPNETLKRIRNIEKGSSHTAAAIGEPSPHLIKKRKSDISIYRNEKAKCRAGSNRRRYTDTINHDIGHRSLASKVECMNDLNECEMKVNPGTPKKADFFPVFDGTIDISFDIYTDEKENMIENESFPVSVTRQPFNPIVVPFENTDGVERIDRRTQKMVLDKMTQTEEDFCNTYEYDSVYTLDEIKERTQMSNEEMDSIRLNETKFRRSMNCKRKKNLFEIRMLEKEIKTLEKSHAEEVEKAEMRLKEADIPEAQIDREEKIEFKKKARWNVLRYEILCEQIKDEEQKIDALSNADASKKSHTP